MLPGDRLISDDALIAAQLQVTRPPNATMAGKRVARSSDSRPRGLTVRDTAPAGLPARSRSVMVNCAAVLPDWLVDERGVAWCRSEPAEVEQLVDAVRSDCAVKERLRDVSVKKETVTWLLVELASIHPLRGSSKEMPWICSASRAICESGGIVSTRGLMMFCGVASCCPLLSNAVS